MKKVIVIVALVWGGIVYNPSFAQVAVNVNISSQPIWGPVGYDYVEYYYLPEAGVYYYVTTGEFIYWNGFEWVFVYALPPRYHVNLYTTYKVVINEPRPYMHNDIYVKRYASYKRNPPKQVIIRDSNDPKYAVVKEKSKNNTAGGVKIKRKDGNAGKIYAKEKGQASGNAAVKNKEQIPKENITEQKKDNVKKEQIRHVQTKKKINGEQGNRDENYRKRNENKNKNNSGNDE